MTDPMPKSTSTAVATDAEVIDYLLGKWRDSSGAVDAFTTPPDTKYGGPAGTRLFDGEYGYGPVPEPVLARLRELGHL